MYIWPGVGHPAAPSDHVTASAVTTSMSATAARVRVAASSSAVVSSSGGTPDACTAVGPGSSAATGGAAGSSRAPAPGVVSHASLARCQAHALSVTDTASASARVARARTRPPRRVRSVKLPAMSSASRVRPDFVPAVA